MMRVTGNKLFKIKSVSIQSNLSGYIFCDTSGCVIADNVTCIEQIETLLKRLRKLTSKIVVKIDISDFIAIPSTLYDGGAHEHYFKVKSIPYSVSRYQYIHSNLLDDTIVVVLPFERDVYKLINSMFSDVIYTHPIIKVLAMAAKADIEQASIFIYSSESYFAMSLISGGKLLFADCIDIASPSDIIYYIRILIAEKSVVPALILCDGVNSDYLAKSISNYNPSVKCISEVSVVK